MVFGAMLVGGMVASGVVAGGLIGHYATRNRYESMAKNQVQQEQVQRAQAQAEEAERAARAAELRSVQTQTNSFSKNNDDTFQRLEKLGKLRQQGLITDEEFQRLKSQLISGY
jgi:multidrug efflux pump subunit AcrA (membrane-fusion protein)